MMTFLDVICAHGCMAIRLMHPPPGGACADNVTAMLGVDLGSQSVVGKVNAVTDLEGKDVSARCAPAVLFLGGFLRLQTACPSLTLMPLLLALHCGAQHTGSSWGLYYCLVAPRHLPCGAIGILFDIVLIAARSATYFQANQSVRMEATAVLDERATLWGAHTFNEVLTYENSLSILKALSLLFIQSLLFLAILRALRAVRVDFVAS